MIGLAGSVAVGKSTTARVLQQMLAHWPEHPNVALVTTDGFLYPNAELERRGILQRKGFPESYDRRALLRFVVDIKSGKDEVEAPIYSHLVYDVVPDETVVVKRPDIVIIEGLNVLQPARVRDDGRAGLTLSDFFDFSVYVDAGATDIRDWYVDRFLRLRETAFRDPTSYFPSTPRCPTTRRSPRPRGSGTRSTGPTWSRTSCRPGPAPPWCCARTATTRSATSGCARSRLERTFSTSRQRSTTRNPSRSLIAFMCALTSALPVMIHSSSGKRSVSARWLATLTARPSRWPRWAGTTSVPPWKPRCGTVSLTNASVIAATSPVRVSAKVVVAAARLGRPLLQGAQPLGVQFSSSMSESPDGASEMNMLLTMLCPATSSSGMGADRADLVVLVVRRRLGGQAVPAVPGPGDVDDLHAVLDDHSNPCLVANSVPGLCRRPGRTPPRPGAAPVLGGPRLERLQETRADPRRRCSGRTAMPA